MANRFRDNETKIKPTINENNTVKEYSLVKAGKDMESREFIVAAEKKESRSKRVNLLVKPSVYIAAKEKCDKLGVSMNECINQFLENWCKE